MLKRHSYKPKGYSDKKLSIEFQATPAINGVDEAISDYVKDEVSKSINNIVDVELLRYKPSFSGEITIMPKFNGLGTNDYSSIGLGAHTPLVLKHSVFILEYMDAPESDKAKVVSTAYVRADLKSTLEILNNSYKAVLRFQRQTIMPEFNLVYVPGFMQKNFSEKIYLRLSFFNAKTGKLLKFGFSNDENLPYATILLNHSTKTYNFESGSSAMEPVQLIKNVGQNSTPTQNSNTLEGELSEPNEDVLKKLMVKINLKRGELAELLQPEFADLGGPSKKYLQQLSISPSPILYSEKNYRISWGSNTDVLPVKLTVETSGYKHTIINATTAGTTQHNYYYDSAPFNFGETETSKSANLVLALVDNPDIRVTLPITLNKYHRTPLVFTRTTVMSTNFTVDWQEGDTIQATWEVDNGITVKQNEYLTIVGVYEDPESFEYRVHVLGGDEVIKGLTTFTFNQPALNGSATMNIYFFDPLYGGSVFEKTSDELSKLTFGGLRGFISTGRSTMVSGSTSGGTQTDPSEYNNPLPTYYSAPIVITTGGTYTGNWESTDENTPAVLIATTQPVIFVNSNFKANGWAVSATGTNGVDITIKNSRHYGGALSNKQRRFVDGIGAFKNLVIENCYLENSAGIKLADGYSGNGTNLQTLKIRYNKAYNIDGRTISGRINSQFFQCDKLRSNMVYQTVNGVDFYQGVPNMEISWNEIINIPGMSDVEDNINIYNTRGTASSPMMIHNNYIHGAYYWDWQGNEYTGSGMICDSPGTNRGLSTAYVDFEDNIVLMSNGASFGIAGGNHINMRRNIAVGKGVINSEVATQLGVTGVGTELKGYPGGVYVTDTRYNMDSTYNNTIVDHTEGVVGENSVSLGYWRNDLSNVANKINTAYATVTNTTNLPNPINRAVEDQYTTLWNQRLAGMGKPIGVVV